jgi:hypothetical protein
LATYDYLFLDVSGGVAGRQRLAERLAPAGSKDRPLGLFVSQLGWQASEAAVLIERGEGSEGEAAATIGKTPGLAVVQARVLRPTLRPAPGASLAAGGVWVHRTFETRAADLQAFVTLSGEAWPDFEQRFDARVFGLFEVVEPRPDPGVIELLLLTRYASHGVWEDSRDPSTEAMRTFARRAALTLRTRAASSLLAWTPS